MSFTIHDFTLKLLTIKDANIHFSETITNKKIKGIDYLVLHAKLSYRASLCPHCGNMDDSRIIKYGTKPTTVKLLPINGMPALLSLKKQRFFCKECGQTFIAVSSLVDKFCSISNAVKSHILDQLTLKMSETDIARDHFVSHSTVSKCIDQDFKRYSPDYSFLPNHLSFDEFKSTKDAKGAMSFIYCDADSKEVIDIVENRQLPFLKRYFSRFSKEARGKVETICMDMYQPYVQLAMELFPNAEITFDRFHIVNLLSRALLKTRIEGMKLFSTYSFEYKRLKKYWKLIQKDVNELDRVHFHKRVHFHEMKSEYELVQSAIAADPTLKESYEVYQTLLQLIKRKNFKQLKAYLLLFKGKSSFYMNTAIETLLKDFHYVQNALIYNYSNGFLEGINNYIKVLKRVAFGYKSFFHFRNRILICRKLLQQKNTR